MAKLAEISIALIVRKSLEEWLNFHPELNQTIDPPEKIWQDFSEKVTLVCFVNKKYELWKFNTLDGSKIEKSNLTFTISPSLKERLRTVSKKSKKTQSEIISDALDLWLIKFNKYENSTDLAISLGAWIVMKAKEVDSQILKSFQYEALAHKNTTAPF